MDAANDVVCRAAPSMVSLPPLSTSRRRLSATFWERSRPVSSEKPMAWISLQGCLVNADEASSAKTIGGGLSAEQAVAWELFSPIHRFLIVAVIGVAIAESQKNYQILQLKKSVELRDQVLSNMQQKLDNLCEQLNNNTENSPTPVNKLSTKDGKLQLNDTFASDNIKFVECGCWHCEEYCDFFSELKDASVRTSSSGNEVVQYKTPFYNEEPEERRMSDLSDWSSSVTSAADIQLNNLVVEQDINNLKRECEEKDSVIKELTTLLSSSEVANCKRVDELEDIIRRKNTTISKLKKDLVVLEQKVVQLSRLRRPSFSAGDSNLRELPQMRDNLVYDMDNTTSPSSSDSDNTPVDNALAKVQNQGSASAINDQKGVPTNKVFSSSRRRVFGSHSESQPVSAQKRVSENRRSNVASASNQKIFSARGDIKKSGRRSLDGAKNATALKRLIV